jgi:hypothetical protein
VCSGTGSPRIYVPFTAFKTTDVGIQAGAAGCCGLLKAMNPGDSPLQARGHWFEPSCAHSQVRALLASSGGAWRRVSTSCVESAPAWDLAALAEVNGGFGLICVAWVQAAGSASPS